MSSPIAFIITVVIRSDHDTLQYIMDSFFVYVCRGSPAAPGPGKKRPYPRCSGRLSPECNDVLYTKSSSGRFVWIFTLAARFCGCYHGAGSAATSVPIYAANSLPASILHRNTSIRFGVAYTCCARKRHSMEFSQRCYSLGTYPAPLGSPGDRYPLGLRKGGRGNWFYVFPQLRNRSSFAPLGEHRLLGLFLKVICSRCTCSSHQHAAKHLVACDGLPENAQGLKLLARILMAPHFIMRGHLLLCLAGRT